MVEGKSVVQGRPRVQPLPLPLRSMFSLPTGENNAELDVHLSRGSDRRKVDVDLLLFEHRERQINQPILDAA